MPGTSVAGAWRLSITSTADPVRTTASSAAPGQSNRVAGTIPGRRGTAHHDTATAATTTGTLTRKIARHPPTVSRSPPRSGPRPAANATEPPTIPNAPPRRSAGTSSRIRPAPFGNTTAPETACSTRNTIRNVSPGAAAAPSDARPNTISPPTTNGRRPCRSPSLPATGWTTASASRYVVTSQPTVPIEESKSSTIRGSATAIMVELSGASSVPSAMPTSTPRTCGCASAGTTRARPSAASSTATASASTRSRRSRRRGA